MIIDQNLPLRCLLSILLDLKDEGYNTYITTNKKLFIIREDLPQNDGIAYTLTDYISWDKNTDINCNFTAFYLDTNLEIDDIVKDNSLYIQAAEVYYHEKEYSSEDVRMCDMVMCDYEKDG